MKKNICLFRITNPNLLNFKNGFCLIFKLKMIKFFKKVIPQKINLSEFFFVFSFKI